MLEPRLIEAIGRSPARPAAVVRRVAPPETVRLLASLLEGVVEQGTGTSAAVPGYSVAGKTGTAQKFDPSTGRYSTTAYVGSFVGFAPLKDPRFTILVVMDSPKKGYYGADVAAPIFSKLMSRLLALEGIVPDKPFLATAPR